MTELQDVSARLADDGLVPVAFPFLTKDPNFIRVLLFQPTGVIVADATHVRVKNQPLLVAQMRGFLKRARELNVDLVACPEYSCPWDALCEAITEGDVPENGKLWAIACQSIKLDEVHARLQPLQAHCRIVMDLPDPGANGTFLDPLCYLFNSTNAGSEAKLTLLLQFKTCQMGGDTYESEHLALGKTLYRFGEQGGNRLVSLLCSDTLSQTFKDNIVKELRHNTLVLHLQLNPHGNNELFRAYRKECCIDKPRDTEVLCLNWAKGTMLDGEEGEFIEEPRTILFRDAHDVQHDERDVLKNHKSGCYLTYWATMRSAAFVFSPDPQIFVFQMSKPYIQGAGPLATRVGIIMQARYLWAADSWAEATADADDRFDNFWYAESPELQPYMDPIKSTLEVERVVQLSTGYGLEKQLNNWQTAQSFRLEEDDTARRLKVCWAKTGDGYNFRSQCKGRFRGFVAILNNKAQFSARLIVFKENTFEVRHNSTVPHKHHRNLHIAGGQSATAMFLGMTPEKAELDRVKGEIQKRVSDFGGDPELLAIWYRDENGLLKDHMDNTKPQINDDPSAVPTDIDNPVL